MSDERRLRIIHSEAATSFGGQEHRVFKEMVAMRERGHYLEAICQPDAELTERLREAGFASTETLRRLGPVPLGKDITYSTLVTDKDGKLLRPFITKDGYWRLPVTSQDVDPRFLAMLIAYEDKRFHQHVGRGHGSWQGGFVAPFFFKRGIDARRPPICVDTI